MNEQMSENQVNHEYESRKNALMQLLTATDYKALKFAEGAISEEEFAETKAKRQAWREEINVIDAEIEAKDNVIVNEE